MRLEEVARLLFVSPAHLRLLLERGELRAEPGTDAGDVDIDVASIDAYWAVLDEARRRYFASEDEREEQLGD
jgi:hypothetical protein